jgi:hypothetical protein
LLHALRSLQPTRKISVSVSHVPPGVPQIVTLQRC